MFYIQHPDCIHKKVNEDTLFILHMDNSDFFLEVTNVVKEIWLFLDQKRSFEEIKDFSSDRFTGERSKSDELTEKVIQQLLDQKVITSVPG
jgi:hypothetical protein